MTSTTAIGLMSGTSMDGIDVAAVVTDGENRVERGATAFYSYDAAFRRRLEAALETARTIVRRDDRPGDLADLETEITRRHADAVKRFLAGAGSGLAPDLIGFHGQTVLHRPDSALTVQLGNGAGLANALGVTVVHDMRAADMAHGGQGAPLIPAYHAAVVRSLPSEKVRFPVVFVNIGGISNVTYVPEIGDPIAFDSGPGNALIDQWVTREGGVPFDAGGAIASEGSVLGAVVERYLASPFFERKAPKSLDRNDFTLAEAAAMELADGARTLARVSAEAIARAAAHMPERPALWIVGGGGRKNPHIMRDLGECVAPAEVVPAEEFGLDGDALEAQAWAYLAVRASKGLPLTWPSTTGCRYPVTGGVLTRPASSSGKTP